MLPKPPNEKEAQAYLKANKAFLYSFSIFSSTLLLVGGVFFALARPEFSWFLAYTIFVSAYLGLGYVIGLFAKGFNVKTHNELVRKNRHLRPTIDIYLPSAGEPLAVLENTYQAVEQIAWTRPIDVYVLDDSDRASVKALANKYHFSYIARPKDVPRLFKKSGNVRNAFGQTSGKFIAIFDADFCPRMDFFDHILAYFNDPKMAIVQTPQYFDVTKQMNWIEAGSGAVQELFYRLIQPNRDHFGGAICVGTNAVYRREALAPLGGTYPIEHSEDVHTGFWCLSKGWKIKYLPINLAKGLCPDNLSGYLNQQYRWCLGSTTLFLNRKFFWGAKITKWQRACYLSGMLFYQATALSVFINFIPGLLVLHFYPQNIHWYNMAFSIPSFLFGTIHMRLWNKAPYGFSALRARVVSYHAHFFAIKDKIFGQVLPWVPTGAAVKNNLERRYKRMVLSVNLGVIALGAWGLYNNPSLEALLWAAMSGFYVCLNLSAIKERPTTK